MLTTIKRWYNNLVTKIEHNSTNQSIILEELEQIKLQVGALHAALNNQFTNTFDLNDVEFKAYSQFGDDGIIQYLIKHANIDSHKFIEFGVQDYAESNTRFLLLNKAWKGLIIDGDKQAMQNVRDKDYYWRNSLVAVGEFITKENINQLFIENGFSGEIGILSIDLDGNDYWIWESIHAVTPQLVIVEYNSLFGAEHAVTIPYIPDFDRKSAHFSYQYWGASLAAFERLADRKGYSLIYCNANGNNAYFLRNDKLGKFTKKASSEVFREASFRDSRDGGGRLSFEHKESVLKMIEGFSLYDIDTNRLFTIKEIISSK